ncbi:RING-HC finger protein [Candidatus Woesebacteria bacterium]|nr:RING-HC finger protein [Candidatus Woesebacteria bacterium]
MVNKENFSPQQSSDFEALDYLESERSEVEFFKDLETLLLEYLQKPSEYTALLSSEGRLTDHKGLSLVEMGEKAESKYSGTTRYDRIHAETDGLRGLEYFYNTGSEKDVFVLAMPPGTKEESFGNVSMTNISVISNEDGQKVITTYTIPTRNLSISSHDLILANAREGLDVETIDINHSERPDLIRSSHPLRIIDGVEGGALEVLAKELGFVDFVDLKKIVKEALEVKDDPKALSRRKGLLAYLSMQIVSFRNKQNREGLIALGRTVRAVFALESVGKFEEKDDMEMIAEFKNYMHGFMRKQELDKSFGSTRTMDTMSNDQQIKHLWRLQNLINSSPEARDRLEGSSCGGGGFEDMFNTKYGGDLFNLKSPSIMQDILGQSENSKEEEYDFDHEGKCVVCNNDPRQLGPCGICEECDTKIRAQVE